MVVSAWIYTVHTTPHSPHVLTISSARRKEDKNAFYKCSGSKWKRRPVNMTFGMMTTISPAWSYVVWFSYSPFRALVEAAHPISPIKGKTCLRRFSVCSIVRENINKLFGKFVKNGFQCDSACGYRLPIEFIVRFQLKQFSLIYRVEIIQLWF